MAATAMESPRFVRRTRLGPNEYRRNFHQIDHDVLAAITSAEADQVTPLMSKIYLRLVSAPPEFWEREGVLYFSAGEEGGQPVKASKVLYGLLGVASATAHKALGWMHEQGIVGYFAGKNGAGIRIFLNRAAGSIGVRSASAGKKILPFDRGSNEGPRGSTGEPAFNDSYAVLEVSDTDRNPRAQKSGADNAGVVKSSSVLPRPVPVTPRPAGTETTTLTSVDELAELLLAKLEPTVRAAAAQAAAREHGRTREWLESHGLPKAARVAQREAYNVLRKYGAVRDTAQSAHAEVGRGHAVHEHHPLSENDVEELAQACVALLEVRGQSVEVTLSEMGVGVGGFLLPEDMPRVRQKVESLIGDSTARPFGRQPDR